MRVATVAQLGEPVMGVDTDIKKVPSARTSTPVIVMLLTLPTALAPPAANSRDARRMERLMDRVFRCKSTAAGAALSLLGELQPDQRVSGNIDQCRGLTLAKLSRSSHLIKGFC